MGAVARDLRKVAHFLPLPAEDRDKRKEAGIFCHDFATVLLGVMRFMRFKVTSLAAMIGFYAEKAITGFTRR